MRKQVSRVDFLLCQICHSALTSLAQATNHLVKLLGCRKEGGRMGKEERSGEGGGVEEGGKKW